MYDKAKFKEIFTPTRAKYIPLDERTKTLANFKKGDSTERLKEASCLLSSPKEKEELALKLKN